MNLGTGACETIERAHAGVAEPVPDPGRHDRDPRGDRPEERAAGAPVRAVMRHDERFGIEPRPAKYERRFTRGFDVAREERRAALRRAEAQHETPVVDRSAPVGVFRMGHVEAPSEACDTVARAHPSHRDALRMREVDHAPHTGIVLGACRDP